MAKKNRETQKKVLFVDVEEIEIFNVILFNVMQFCIIIPTI